jgi:hypothetical protein
VAVQCCSGRDSDGIHLMDGSVVEQSERRLCRCFADDGVRPDGLIITAGRSERLVEVFAPMTDTPEPFTSARRRGRRCRGAGSRGRPKHPVSRHPVRNEPNVLRTPSCSVFPGGTDRGFESA